MDSFDFLQLILRIFQLSGENKTHTKIKQIKYEELIYKYARFMFITCISSIIFRFQSLGQVCT